MSYKITRLRLISTINNLFFFVYTSTIIWHSSTSIEVSADGYTVVHAWQTTTCNVLAVKRYTDDFGMDATKEDGKGCLTSLQSVTCRASCVVLTVASVAAGTSPDLRQTLANAVLPTVTGIVLHDTNET